MKKIFVQKISRKKKKKGWKSLLWQYFGITTLLRSEMSFFRKWPAVLKQPLRKWCNEHNKCEWRFFSNPKFWWHQIWTCHRIVKKILPVSFAPSVNIFWVVFIWRSLRLPLWVKVFMNIQNLHFFNSNKHFSFFVC